MFFIRLFRNTKLRGLTIGLLCAVACWLMNSSRVIRNLENWALDVCYVFREERPGPTEIVIIAIDDATVKSLDKPMMFITPELAEVVKHVSEGGAKSVGIDFMVPDDRHEIPGLQAGGQGDPTMLGTVRSNSAESGESESTDQYTSQTPVVLPELVVSGEDREIVFPLRQWLNESIQNEIFGFELVAEDADPTDLILKDPNWRSMGFVNVFPDDDMSVRHQQLSIQPIIGDDHTEPSFAYAIYAASENLDAECLQKLCLANPKDGSGELDAIPVDSKGNMLINYRGPSNSFQRVSFLDVLTSARKGEPADQWKDKIVLIGETYGASPDKFATPFSNHSLTRLLWSSRKPEMMPGVEIHANTIATLGDRDFITTPWFMSTPVVLLVTGALMGIILMRVNLELGLVITFLHHWLWKLVCILAFAWFDWRVEMISVLLLGTVLFGFIFAMRWRWIRKMMGMVKSEEVARALEHDPSSLDLKGEDRVITILFSDIRNFTTYSENHTPHEVVTMLNTYFAAVVPIIEKHGGVVNQYIGDGLMVLFGAPQRSDDHALRAVRSAIEMIEKLHEMQETWAKLDAPDLRIGVGIHTGHCVVGTVGSPRRLDYTAIGDTTNTSARIEAGNKELGTEILISESTVDALGEDVVEFESLIGEPQPLALKGKSIPLLVHEVLPPSLKTQSTAEGSQETG